MSICKGRTVSDSESTKFPFYDNSGNKTNKYYFLALGCKNRAISNELCGICLSKNEKLKGVTIDGNKLKDKDGKRIWQPRVLHGKIDEPIPSWSEIENGIIYNERLKSGLQISSEMPPKKKEVSEKEKEKEKEKRVVKKTKPANTSNVVVELQPKMYIDTSETKEAFEIKRIEVKTIKLNGKDYYYDTNKNKVYTKDFDYVGRYDTKTDTLCTDYPDSDNEPSF